LEEEKKKKKKKKKILHALGCDPHTVRVEGTAYGEARVQCPLHPGVPTPSLVAEIRKDTQARVPLKQRATGMGARELAGHRHGLALLHVPVRGDIEARKGL
jgi:hypothetical protein